MNIILILVNDLLSPVRPCCIYLTRPAQMPLIPLLQVSHYCSLVRLSGLKVPAKHHLNSVSAWKPILIDQSLSF